MIPDLNSREVITGLLVNAAYNYDHGHNDIANMQIAHTQVLALVRIGDLLEELADHSKEADYTAD